MAALQHRWHKRHVVTKLRQKTQCTSSYSLGMEPAPEPNVPSWTLLSNHAHVLVAISQDPDARQKDIAYAVGITIGAVQRIVHELEEAGYLRSEKIGRRNHYHVVDDVPLRHPLESHHTVSDLIKSIG